MTEIVPFVHEGLGNSSYLVHAGGDEAFLVDPDRSASRYLEAASERGWRIASVFETHLHADFVTGALEVGAGTGASIHAAAEGHVAFEHHGRRGGDRVQVGDVEIEVRATPGHTPEHLSYVARGPHRAAPPLVFSGGALIVGGAARTDLIAADRTDPLTRALYRDVRHAFDDLPDETVLLPTHGGGSFCSAGAGGQRWSTLGEERVSNVVLTFRGDEEAFATWFPSTFPGTPAYYARMRASNAAGPRLVREIPPPPRLDALALAATSTAGAIVLDVRSPESYATGHVPGSLAIPFRDSFPVWLGWLAPPDVDLVLVLDGEPLDDVLAAARLVGYERVVGLLDGGLAAWRGADLPVSSVALLSPGDAMRGLGSDAILVDVREPDEVAGGTAPGARAIALGALAGHADTLPKNSRVIVTCGVGERATSAASIWNVRASRRSRAWQAGWTPGAPPGCRSYSPRVRRLVRVQRPSWMRPVGRISSHLGGWPSGRRRRS